MDMLRYAHENGCPWDKNPCNIAVIFGNM
ncbi:hypothetical protein FWK35_00033832 [Aphis craccivora]|uniref:Uncharacterized protein n=1 Tax=Aphis craccivora TaxID=307492 RepID=A0A6G0VKT6_APHCR|nr:hypothetical protein FWK35_00033832 [Aphis craccivora]